MLFFWSPHTAHLVGTHLLSDKSMGCLLMISLTFSHSLKLILPHDCLLVPTVPDETYNQWFHVLQAWHERFFFWCKPSSKHPTFFVSSPSWWSSCSHCLRCEVYWFHVLRDFYILMSSQPDIWTAPLNVVDLIFSFHKVFVKCCKLSQSEWPSSTSLLYREVTN